MATTTNYGWTTPDDTALVKDGAAAIRTLGSSADTTVKTLNPGTTSGDLDYYTSSTAKARIGIGTNGQVLTSNGSVPSWATPTAGGMTLISSTALSGASVILSSIPQTYQYLTLIIYGVTNATAQGNFVLRPNGSSTITNQSSATSQSASISNNNAGSLNLSPGEILRTSANNTWAVNIYNYISTTRPKSFLAVGNYEQTGPVQSAGGIFGGIQTNSAITSITILNTGGNLSTGTVELYGVK
jgi:hypothetical protein